MIRREIMVYLTPQLPFATFAASSYSTKQPTTTATKKSIYITVEIYLVVFVKHAAITHVASFCSAVRAF